MKFEFFIARRYLFSKKSTNAINIISFISMIGVCIGTAALFVILSVFNGFEELNISLYKKLSPDLKIVPATGKYFKPSAILPKLSNEKEIDYPVEVIEDNALLRYGNTQYFATIMGVSENFLRSAELKDVISAGEFVLEEGDMDYAVIGRGIEYALNINVNQPVEQISFFAPKKHVRINTIDPGSALKRMELYPSGVFNVQQEMEDRVIFVPLRFARELTGEKENLTSVDIYLKDEAKMLKIQKNIQQTIGDDYVVKNRFQLNELLYKVLNTERWAVYLVMTFILIVAICNIIGSVTMLVIDKKKDIGILMSMGADKTRIRRIFMLEGMLIAMIGAVAGLIIGGIFTFLQKTYGLISINASDAFILHAYPVKINYPDFLLVFSTVFVIAYIASVLTARSSIHNFSNTREVIAE